jgi:hypothetical protein
MFIATDTQASRKRMKQQEPEETRGRKRRNAYHEDLGKMFCIFGSRAKRSDTQAFRDRTDPGELKFDWSLMLLFLGDECLWGPYLGRWLL